ncbi:hypothetical protein BKA62DRAFT_414129 [Auriculariales sp. MPI-PUGE-AT-0066]|nr:hypothetical protein BKA62DRAFT_414129 [Auriculariales sp. MPI-PUGE-AT-0066]
MSHEDSIVSLRVEDTEFKISKNLLINASPTFGDLLEYATRNGRVACLDVSAQDFREFLWFLNANPSTFDAYATQADVEAQFLRWLAVATVADKYIATEISRWTVKKMIELLPRYDRSSTQLVRLYRLAQGLARVELLLIRSVRLHWARKIDQSPDPVVWIIPARDVGDNSLQARAYLYVLKRHSVLDIAEDARLDNLDRFRLFVGAANMRDNDINVGEYVPSVLSGTLLWDMFTKSSMGFELPDGMDLSAPDRAHVPAHPPLPVASASSCVTENTERQAEDIIFVL